MTAAIATLIFLTILWMLTVIGLRIAAESAPRIAAAVHGLSAGGYPSAERRRLTLS